MNKKFFLALLTGLMLFTGCNRQSIFFFGRNAGDELNVKPLAFEYLSMKGKLTLDDGKDKKVFKSNFRLRKDSLIWFSVSARVGVEGIRGIITQDSVLMINRLDKFYTAQGFGELGTQLGFEVNYDIIQAALLGDLLVPIKRRDRVEKEGEFFTVNQREGELSLESRVDGRIMKLVEVLVKDGEEGGGELKLSYGDFQYLEDSTIFPHQGGVLLDYTNANGPSRLDMEVKTTKVKVENEPVKFPFKVPDKYEKR